MMRAHSAADMTMPRAGAVGSSPCSWSASIGRLKSRTLSVSFDLFIDGTWRVSQDGRTIDVLNLVSDERLGLVTHAVSPDLRGVEAAVDKGFRIW
jgi:hypothetical protein